jgi:putative FmdB family regulatory protein
VPLYEFRCEGCGPFQEWRPTSKCSDPATCPQCHTHAVRVLTPPNLVRTSPAVRKARGLEEKSAHEPEVVVRPRPKDEAPRRPKPVVSPHPWAVDDGH